MTTTEKQSLASRIMSLFEGFSQAYGTYDQSNFSESKGKLEIKATARTLRSPVTRALWEDHLAGKKPLGIIPIRDNNTCLWGVIDVDQYGLEHQEIVARLKKEDLPLVVCRSKSGGAHLFLFCKEPVPAGILIARLSEIAALLGYGQSEIFPKQHTVQIDRGDLGNWLNMPYFEGDETTRYCVKENGLAMTVAEFVAYAEASKVDKSFLEKERRKKPENDPEFGDGPPCMQHLAATGFPEGVRNKGLYALGLFAKKKFGERWALVLEDWNRRYFEPPLPSSEVSDIIKRLEKKDYNYPCKDQPLVNHCNSSLCRTRRFGVGGDDDYPMIKGLSALDTDPPLWFIDVDDQRLELTTDELMNYPMFQKVCIERLFRVFKSMKRETWQSIIAEKMAQLVKIEAPPEAGYKGRFEELLERFVLDKHRAETIEEIVLGKPYEDLNEDKHYFQLKDLHKFLESEGFKIYSRPQMITRIRSMGGGQKFFNLKGKGVNTWWVPRGSFTATPELDLPKVESSPI